MFLLTPDKTEDRTDREVKSFRLTNGIGSAVHLAVAGGVFMVSFDGAVPFPTRCLG